MRREEGEAGRKGEREKGRKGEREKGILDSAHVFCPLSLLSPFLPLALSLPPAPFSSLPPRYTATEKMDDKRYMLRHFLAALAYRTQKALRDAPEGFGDFQAGNDVRTPEELIRHMTSVLGYARTFFIGGEYRPEPLPTFRDEIERFHDMLGQLRLHLESEMPLTGLTEEQLLQGQFSDAMTHAGQLAMLRRLHGKPVRSENFIHAAISAENLTPDQPEPVAPDE